jgi:ribosomal protein L18E
MDSANWFVVATIAALAWAGVVARIVWKMGGECKKINKAIDKADEHRHCRIHRKGNEHGDQ